MKKIYVSGKISELKDTEIYYNFEIARDKLKEKYNVITPIDNGINWDIPYTELIANDIKALLDCDCIYMLKNWKDSKGAKLEYQIAEMTGKEILYE